MLASLANNIIVAQYRNLNLQKLYHSCGSFSIKSMTVVKFHRCGRFQSLHSIDLIDFNEWIVDTN